jgi:hypothetical protein
MDMYHRGKNKSKGVKVSEKGRTRVKDCEHHDPI